jgi:hypothetical protein
MLCGTATAESMLAHAPQVEIEPGRALEVGKVQWLQLTYELAGDRLNFDVLPPGLHPTTPLVATVQLWRAQGGELGEFGLAQLRLTSRAGMRIRAYLLQSVIDGKEAAATLTRRFGYGPQLGTVSVHRRADRIEGSVLIDGRPVFEGCLLEPQSLDTSAIQHITNMNPARTAEGLTLLQVDPHFQQSALQRGAQRLTTLDCDFWRIPGRTLKYPVIGVAGEASVTIPPIVYTHDPIPPQTAA